MKKKGMNAERELIHMFWKHDWAAIRVAGSGSMRYPAPDIIASKDKQTVCLEVKISKGNYIYLSKQEVLELQKFSNKFNAKMFIVYRFDREEWKFATLGMLRNTEKHFVVKRTMKGISFSELLQNTY